VKTKKELILWLQVVNMGIILPEGLSYFAFRRLSEKQKKQKTLRPLRLCGDIKVFLTHFEIIITLPFGSGNLPEVRNNGEKKIS
jgi:hypothetical protein